jgi:hypothetical protein
MRRALTPVGVLICLLLLFATIMIMAGCEPIDTGPVTTDDPPPVVTMWQFGEFTMVEAKGVGRCIVWDGSYAGGITCNWGAK